MKLFLAIILLFPLISVAQQAPKHEFRGVWVATVNNIDWPSRPGLTTAQQKQEILTILDRHQKDGFNAIIFQVRPAADAFYASELEPWSRYLTGTPGKAPEPFYDPLKFWIDECHKRNMEFHAWLNPFRISQKDDEPLAGNHVAFKHPEWIVNYGNRLYFDPGIPQAREFIAKVVADIVARYDVDAIHMDDYFYPYPLETDFPDANSFAQYNNGFRPEQKADWRRQNVDLTIQLLSRTIKKTKPWVKFGISPFGVWRNIADDPRGSQTSAGTTNYDQLYADVIKWQEKGWIDYLMPQIYWQIGHPSVDFLTLSRWWADHSYKRGMYIGHALYKFDLDSPTPEWRKASELTRQIQITRQIRQIDGSAFYSSKHFNRNIGGFSDSLQNHYYKYPAIVPTMPWIDSKAPDKPKRFKKSGTTLKWKKDKAKNETDKVRNYIVYMVPEGTKFNPDDPSQIFTLTPDNRIVFKPNAKKQRRKYEFRISALDRLHNESAVSKPKTLKL